MLDDLVLPIANIVVNPGFIIFIGFIGGLLTGLFGVGSGLFVTPTLIALGVPPLIAVTSQVNSMIGISLTGYLAYNKSHDVDYKLGRIIIAGGGIGAILGVIFLEQFGKSETSNQILATSYEILVGAMAILLFRQSQKNLTQLKGGGPEQKPVPPQWITKFPIVRYFPRSRLTISCVLLFITGVVNGGLVGVLGVGNGVFMMPVLLYFSGRTSPVAYGTTLLASVVITVISTLVHALHEDFIDLTLVVLLLMGGLLGGQLGVLSSYKIPRVYLGFAGAVVMVLMLIQLIFKMAISDLSPFLSSPSSPYSLTELTAWLQYLEMTSPILYVILGIGLSIAFPYAFQTIKTLGGIVKDRFLGRFFIP
jgi:uncharacterized protein